MPPTRFSWEADWVEYLNLTYLSPAPDGAIRRR